MSTQEGKGGAHAGAQKQRVGSGLLQERLGSAGLGSASNESSSPSAERVGRADLQVLLLLAGNPLH